MLTTRRGVLPLFVIAVIEFLSFTEVIQAQGSKEDFDRAQSLPERASDKVFRDRVAANWFADGNQFWYEVKTGPESKEWVLVDAVKLRRGRAFDHVRLATALMEASGKTVTAENLPLTGVRFSGDMATLHFAAIGKRWSCDLANYTLKDVGEQDDERTTVNVLDRPRPSRADGQKTSIHFFNHTTGKVKLLLVDQAGERTEAGVLESDSDSERASAAGQVWIATDENDRPLGVFEAVEKPGVAVIEGSARPAAFGRGGLGLRGRGGNPNGAARSPDGKWRAAISDHNLFIRSNDTDEEIRLTTDGTADDPYVERFYWSADSKKLVGIQEKVGENRKISFVESSPSSQVQPILHQINYAKPGDKLPVARPRLFDIATRKKIPLAEDLFPNAWSITEVRWRPDSKRFSFLFNERGHQVLRIVGVDAESGETKAIVDEHSPTFIDYSGKMFSYYLDDSREIIWMSERDGWNHLYLYDADTGQVKSQITHGPWVVRGVDRIDEQKRQIWFRAGGIYGEQEP